MFEHDLFELVRVMGALPAGVLLIVFVSLIWHGKHRRGQRLPGHRRGPR